MQRAHARRLLVTLAGICQLLRLQQSSPAAREAYRQVEQDLLGLMDRPRKGVLARFTKRGAT